MALDGRTQVEAYRDEPHVDMMDQPPRALPAYHPRAQQPQQEDRFKGILAAGDPTGMRLNSARPSE